MHDPESVLDRVTLAALHGGLHSSWTVSVERDEDVCHSGLVCSWQLLLVAAMAWIKCLFCCLCASVSIVKVSSVYLSDSQTAH